MAKRYARPAASVLICDEARRDHQVTANQVRREWVQGLRRGAGTAS